MNHQFVNKYSHFRANFVNKFTENVCFECGHQWTWSSLASFAAGFVCHFYYMFQSVSLCEVSHFIHIFFLWKDWVGTCAVINAWIIFKHLCSNWKEKNVHFIWMWMHFAYFSFNLFCIIIMIICMPEVKA